MSLRPATVDDVDALTAIHVAAMPMDPNFPYLFPRRSEYAEDYYEFVKEEITSALNAATNEVATMVVEMPDASCASKKRVVAFATWELPGPSVVKRNPDTEHTESSQPARTWRHLNQARWDAYIPASNAARARFFDSKYGERQLFLGEMVCEPAFQRHGHGKKLMAWGVQKATQEKVAITTFASSMGQPLYESFGMKQIGAFRVQVEREGEFIENPALTLDAPLEPKSGLPSGD